MKGALTIDKIALLVLAILVIVGVSYIVLSEATIFEEGITSIKCKVNEITYCELGSVWNPACGTVPDCGGGDGTTTTTRPTTPTTTASTTTTIPTESHDLKTYIPIYGGVYPATDTDIDYLASNFELIDTQENYIETVKKVKAKNPDTIVVFYKDLIATQNVTWKKEEWEYVNQFEDWFLHDTDGNRIRTVGWGGWYLMNPGSDGWRNYFANYVKDALEKNPQFDGVFADDTWGTFPPDSWNYFQNDESKIPDYIKNNTIWTAWVKGMLKKIKDTIGDKLLIINCNRDPLVYIDYVDGRLDEGFAHACWQTASQYFGVKEWRNDIDVIYEWSSRNKYVIAQGGVEGATYGEKKKWMNFTLHSYLLAFNGAKAMFAFKPEGYAWEDRYYWLHPEYEHVSKLGVPTGTYKKDPEDPIFYRDFENGKVLVNPSTGTYTFDLGENYKTLDGKIVSKIALGAHSGIMLLKISPPS